MSASALARARVEQILGRLARPGQVLLDIPAGTGPLRARAQAQGWRVVGLDLFPRPGSCQVQADACAPLPLRSGSFDAVVSQEGIEHFEDQTGYLRECARVLRPGGTLILSTPNILHLSARMAFLLSGQRGLQHGLVNEVSHLWARDGERLLHGHAYLVDAFKLRYMLRIVGLELVEATAVRVSPSSVALLWMWPLVWLASRQATRAMRRMRAERGWEPLGESLERELLALATSPSILLARKLLLVARKPGTDRAVPEPDPRRATR